MTDDPAWVERAGCRLRYLRRGPGPVAAALIHELGGSLDSWDGLVVGLPGALRLVRYDQRGHGESSCPAAPYALTEHVEDLRAVLDHAAVTAPCWLIAAAAGAAIAVAFAARYSVRVMGIVMCAPALEVDRARRDELRSRADAATRRGMTEVADAALARSWPAAERGDGQAFARYRARMLAGDPRGYAFASRALGDIDLAGSVAALRCPCLFLAGEHDAMRPPAGVAAQAARVAHAVFDTVPAGHLMSVQRPAQVAAKVAAFLAEHRS